MSDDEGDDPFDDDDMELDEIELYQAVDLEAYIEPDNRDALKDTSHGHKDHDCTCDGTTYIWPSPHPVGKISMPIAMSDIIESPKTNDFCQAVFATMAQAKSFFLEGDDGVPLRPHPSILELDHIVFPKRFSLVCFT